MTLDIHNTERYLAAHHEAGHCVGAWYFGGRILTLELAGARGHCRYNHPGLNCYRHQDPAHEEVKAGILIALAGIAASARASKKLYRAGLVDDCGWTTECAEQDVALCAARLSLICPEALDPSLSLDDLYKRLALSSGVLSWLWERGVWPAIEVLAQALLERGTLSGQQAVTTILAAWQGPPPPKALPIEQHSDGKENQT
jgi:hypothetical protein